MFFVNVKQAESWIISSNISGFQFSITNHKTLNFLSFQILFVKSLSAAQAFGVTMPCHLMWLTDGIIELLFLATSSQWDIPSRWIVEPNFHFTMLSFQNCPLLNEFIISQKNVIKSIYFHFQSDNKFCYTVQSFVTSAIYFPSA